MSSQWVSSLAYLSQKCDLSGIFNKIKTNASYADHVWILLMFWYTQKIAMRFNGDPKVRTDASTQPIGYTRRSWPGFQLRQITVDSSERTSTPLVVLPCCPVLPGSAKLQGNLADLDWDKNDKSSASSAYKYYR